MEGLLYGMDDYGYGYGDTVERIEWLATSIGISFFLALILTIVAFVVLLPANKRGKLKGFALWLHDFLNFKILFVEAILKFVYVLATAFTIIYCVLNMFNKNFLTTVLITLIVLIAVRISYELMMLSVILVTNVVQINNKLKGDAGKVDMFRSDVDLNRFVPKQAPMHGYGQMQQGQPQPPVSPMQPAQSGQPVQPQPPVQPAQPQQPQLGQPVQPTQSQQPEAPQGYPRFCKMCGSPIDQTTGKCPNCNQ